MIDLLIGDPESDMVNSAGSGTMRSEIRAHPNMQFGPGSPSAHFEDLDVGFFVVRIGVFQGRPHPQNVCQKSSGQFQFWNGDGGRTESPDLVGRRYRATGPGEGFSGATVID